MSLGEQEVRAAPGGGLLRAVAVVIAAWAVAAVGVLLVAAGTSAGPVVVTLSVRHGIHAGDLLALVFCSAWAVLVTAAEVRRYRWARSGE